METTQIFLKEFGVRLVLSDSGNYIAEGFTRPEYSPELNRDLQKLEKVLLDDAVAGTDVDTKFYCRELRHVLNALQKLNGNSKTAETGSEK